MSQLNLGYTGDPDHGSIKYTGDIAFANAANTERLRIMADGKMGLNTSSPLSTFHVRNAGSENGSLRVGGNGASLGLELTYDQSGATTSIIQANPTYTSTSSLMKIRTDGDGNPNQLVLDGAGNVLVGGTTFDNGNFSGSANGINVFDATVPIVNLVETTGNTSFFMAKTTSSCYIGTADAHFIGFSTSDAEQMRLDAQGRLGLGTSSMSSYYSDKFVINAGDEDGITIVGGVGENNYIMFADGTSGNERYKGYIQYDHAYDYMVFASNGSSRLTIDSAGRILIGTTTAPDNTAADDLTLSGTGHIGMTIRSTDSTSSRIYFADATSGTGEYAGYFLYDHSNNSLQVGTNSAERLRVDSSGTLLIGKTVDTQADAGHVIFGAGAMDLLGYTID
jgi:DNA-binding transcriptional regulator/RsmH inhibitor MraZ